jgi:beta-barrel assembly-enhancing protease
MASSLLLLVCVCSCVPSIKTVEEWLTPSVKSEKEMGREFAQEAAKHLTLVEEPDVVEYIYHLGQPIVDAAQPMSYRFRFHVVKNPTLNAFAVPGGHLYLYSGLLLKTLDSNQVASVIAHELSHVKLRHTAQMIGKGTLVNLATLGAMLVAAGTRSGGDAGQAAVAGAMGASQAVQLRFSREFEEQADRSGLAYMYQAGYAPMASGTSWRQWLKSSHSS